MPDPITLGTLVVAAITGIAGNRADGLICRFGKEFVAVLTEFDTPRNNEALLAMRRAQLDSLESLAAALRAGKAINTLQDLRESEEFLPKFDRFLQQSRQALEELKLTPEQMTALASSVDATLASPSTESGRQRLVLLSKNATQCTWREIEHLNPTNAFKALFEGCDLAVPSWLQAYGIFLGAALKHNTAFMDILAADRLTNVLGETIDLREVVNGYIAKSERRLSELATINDRTEAKVDVVNTHTSIIPQMAADFSEVLTLVREAAFARNYGPVWTGLPRSPDLEIAPEPPPVATIMENAIANEIKSVPDSSGDTILNIYSAHVTNLIDLIDRNSDSKDLNQLEAIANFSKSKLSKLISASASRKNTQTYRPLSIWYPSIHLSVPIVLARVERTTHFRFHQKYNFTTTIDLKKEIESLQSNCGIFPDLIVYGLPGHSLNSVLRENYHMLMPLFEQEHFLLRAHHTSARSSPPNHGTTLHISPRTVADFARRSGDLADIKPNRVREREGAQMLTVLDEMEDGDYAYMWAQGVYKLRNYAIKSGRNLTFTLRQLKARAARSTLMCLFVKKNLDLGVANADLGEFAADISSAVQKEYRSLQISQWQARESVQRLSNKLGMDRMLFVSSVLEEAAFLRSLSFCQDLAMVAGDALLRDAIM